ncbi:FISUMP domain-containing protein [Fibrobacter sp.]
MKKSFQRVIATLNLFQGKQSLTIFLLAAFFALSACDDSSSASDDNNETSAVESSSSVKDSDSTEESSSSIDKKSSGNETKDKSSSSDTKSSSSTKETKVSSDSKSSSSVKTDDSSSSNKDKSSSSEMQSSSSSVKRSSSSVAKSSSSGEYVPYAHTADLGPLWFDDVFKQFLDTRNNRSYYYLTIYNKDHSDSLTVFAENLNIGEMVDGAKDQSDNDKIERYCYDNDTTNCDRYGGLYQWAEMMGFNDSCNTKSCAHLIDENHQGICPQDWRIMTYDDFQFILKSENVTHGIDDLKTQNGFGGYNTTGFSVVGPGYNWDHTFRGFQESTYFFYPQERDDSTTIPSGMSRGTTSTSHTWKLKTHGFSVRCVMIYKKSENN